jgi:hypothetical protein
MIRKMRPASTATLPRAVVVVRIVLNFIIKLTWGIESQGGQFFLGVVDTFKPSYDGKTALLWIITQSTKYRKWAKNGIKRAKNRLFLDKMACFWSKMEMASKDAGRV